VSLQLQRPLRAWLAMPGSATWGLVACGLCLTLPAWASAAEAVHPLVPQASSSFRCESDVDLGNVASAAQKGVALDDTTFWNCSTGIPAFWPNTDEPVRSFRLFKAWDPSWPAKERHKVWEHLKGVVRANDAKLLVGAQITCREKDDERAWEYTKELLRYFRPEDIMGLAVGNEMELLFTKSGVDSSVTPECISNMWVGGYFWQQFVRRVSEFNEMGFADVAVTSVFGGLALAGVTNHPFFEDPRAMVNSFLLNATRRYGRRYVFTINLYPYFDPANMLDPGTVDQCSLALALATCLDSSSCSVPASATRAREKMAELTGWHNGELWVGETGWSSLLSSSLATQMARCQAWSSIESFRTFYEAFLKWDLVRTHGSQDPPDHIFYFTIRDSMNFGVQEHFGLLEECSDPRCKLRSSDYTVPPTTITATSTSTTHTTTADEHTASTTSLPFDCEDGFHEWRLKWSPGKQAWCCLREGLACPVTTTMGSAGHRHQHGAKDEAHHTSIRSTTTTSSTSNGSTRTTTETKTTTTTLTTSSAMPYNCSQTNVSHTWTEAQRSYCCARVGLGCFPAAGTFDCSLGHPDATDARWRWSGTKRAFCCRHKGMGCEAEDGSVVPALPYNCSSHLGSKNWTAGKEAWCCLYQGVRCPSRYTRYTTTGLYDCRADLSNWEHGWSEDKKTWCCENVGLGCSEEMSYTCGDAAADESDWERAWTYKQKQWCCEHEGRGCDFRQVVFGKKFARWVPPHARPGGSKRREIVPGGRPEALYGLGALPVAGILAASALFGLAAALLVTRSCSWRKLWMPMVEDNMARTVSRPSSRYQALSEDPSLDPAAAREDPDSDSMSE